MTPKPTLSQPLALVAAALVLLVISPASSRTSAAGADQYGGREMLVFVPSRLPPQGARALVVVLHGGLGNAERIESQRSEGGLNLDAVAEKGGFIVAYLDGTPVTRFLGAQMLGWNAGGGCCGQPAVNGVDDVGYIAGAVGYLAGKYGVDPGRVYGLGHSNGAMMTQRVVCEAGLYAAAVAVSGPLTLDIDHCPSARGRRVLAIHGADDQNVPVTGGVGAKGLSHVAFKSEDRSRQVMTESGASYVLDVVPGADHAIDHIDAAMERTEGQSIAEKAARFFGLIK